MERSEMDNLDKQKTALYKGRSQRGYIGYSV